MVLLQAMVCAGRNTGMRVQVAPGCRKVTGPHAWHVAQCQVRASAKASSCPAAIRQAPPTSSGCMCTMGANSQATAGSVGQRVV